MQKILIYAILALPLCACDNTTHLISESNPPAILPLPKEVQSAGHSLALTKSSRMFSPNPELYPLLDLLATELNDITGPSIPVTRENGAAADLTFTIDTTLAQEEYHLEIDRTIAIRGGSYRAVAMAKTTLLQMAFEHDGLLAFPAVRIHDYPDAAYRGLLIDLARQWHPIETVKKLVDLAAFYKIGYLQLHFTDHQSYTLPSAHFPKLPTPGRHYSFEELRDLEAYSQLRGVTIIPEIDVPGHSYTLVKAYPEIFALQDTAANPWIINMGRERVYEVLGYLIEELTTVFTATPYLHIGGDEAYLAKVNEDPDVIAYKQKHGIGADVHELYRHFLVRMNSIVKRHGKKMCIWEGFRPEGDIPIPKDILVFEFETNRYLPDELIAAGYTVVNTSWKPLYVVNQKKWAPETIYAWNMWRWENWWDQAPSFQPIQVPHTDLVIGAQMCSWEQPDSVEIPSLRRRVPVFVERIWNTKSKVPYTTIAEILAQTDVQLSLLIDDVRQDSLLTGYDFAAPVENGPNH